MDDKREQIITDRFIRFIAGITDEDVLREKLNLLMSPGETFAIAQRLEAAKMLNAGKTYSEIVRETDINTFILSRLETILENTGDELDCAPESYKSFASVYDELTHDVEYEKRFKYIEKIFKKYNTSPKIVLDLACGTGGMTTIMAKNGYDMIGVDISTDMLEAANAKSDGLNILYLNQPMQELDLYGTVDAAICLLDSINYLEDEDEMLQTFRLVENFLNPKGLFIFDINTKYKLEHVLAGNVFCGEDDNVYYTWQNFYDKEEKVCEFKLDFFITEDGVINRHTEYHYETAFGISEIKRNLKKAGFELLEVCDDLTFDAPHRKSEKVFFIARKIR